MPPSAFTSPTSATTFDVPMSRPTIKPLSERLAMLGITLIGVMRHRGRASPSNCKTICVTHVDIFDVGCALGDDLDGRRDEPVEAFVELAAAEPHGHAVREIEFPRAARVVAQGRDVRAG